MSISSDPYVPYAVMNYRTLVKEDFFFVDHTRYLRELEKYQTPVFLRPKRFGKSLWVSMLEFYYDVRFKDQFQELFGKTEIGRNPTPRANSFLVLSLDFSTITLGSVAEIERSFTTKLRLDAETFCVLHKELCNWYLNKFVNGRGAIPPLVIDTNVRTDIKWFRRLAQTNENAVVRMREYFEQGQTEPVSLGDLMPRFRRMHPLSPENLPILLYYLGWLTFVDDNLLGCPNLYTQKLFVEVAGNRGYNWHTLQP